jgi:hypothetical protein
MTDISELRKREIADKFAKLVAEGTAVYEAAELVGIQYNMSRREILDVVKEVKGSL